MPKRDASQLSATGPSSLEARIYSKRKRSGKSGVGRMAMSRKWARREVLPNVGKLIINPFPITYRTTLTWAPAAGIDGAVSSAVYQWKLNDLFDPDPGSIFGTTTQPLYFDQICSATGPYKSYIVHGWRTKVTVINTTGIADTVPGQTLCDVLEVICQQGYELSAEGDTNSELQSAPNRQRVLLSPMQAGCNNRYTFYLSGKTTDYSTKPAYDSTHAGTYTASPAIVIFGNIGCRSLNGDNYNIAIAMQHEFDVEFFNTDAAAS